MRTFTLLAIFTAAIAATTAAFNAFTSQGQAADAPSAADVPSLPEPSTGEDTSGGTEVLTRGPVHEAYATPLELNPQAGPVIKKEPPSPVEEVPPDQKPEGDNVVWIPGYFAWDEDRQDFLWISGVWRNVPPGQTWVAGYWNKADDGYQWTPGFWTGAKKEEVSYVTEAPPSTLEAGPMSPQPSDNHFWIPGNWVYQDHYVWQPGYWAAVQPNWVWVPAHWMWSPGGFVFVGGFWDYVPAYRGCLFAPVYFSSAVYARPHFVWCPGVVINVGFFSGNLFCGPSHRHYYFGDYYAQRYSGMGFRPWFEVGGGRRAGYDPLFTYYRWKDGRSNPNWLAQQKQHFETLQKNAADRPPATFAAQKEWMQKNRDAGKKGDFVAATTLAQAVKEPNVTGFKMHNVSQQNRQEMLSQAQALNKFSKERLEVEKQNTSTGSAGEGAGGRGTASTMAAQKLKLPTLGATQTKGSGSGAAQTLSQQGQGGETGAGRTGGRFNKQPSGVTVQDQQSGPMGKPTLGDKGDQNVQAVDQNKTFNPGRPFGLNKPANQDKTSDQDQPRNPLTTRSGQVTGPAGGDKPQVLGQNKPSDDDKPSGQDKPRNIFGQGSGQGTGSSGGDKAQGSTGKPNMTLVPPGAGAGDQGGAGKPNVTSGTQGQGGGVGSARGNVKVINPPGGGGGNQPRFTPSNQQQKKDKDDDQQQQQQRNKNRSDTTPPRTNFTMDSDEKHPMNLGGIATAEKEAMQRDIAHRSGAEDWAKDALNDKLTNDKLPTATPRAAATKPQSNDLAGPPTPGVDQNTKAPGPAVKPIPDGYRPAPGSGPTGAAPSSSASTSVYQSLMQRGRSLSQPGATNPTASAGGDNSDANPRLKKDPVGSYSYGSSPTRFPSIAAPYAAGGQGPTARAAATPGTLGGGLGSIQKYTPGAIPKLQRGMGNSYSAPANDTDPSARTYDPSQQSTNSYGR